jgi:7-carboxy-7-deazaguanine synthase (Cx14CxxC type)
MTYSVKEIFYSLQGEGFHTGRPAVFCRFTGCNLWSGREEDRSKAICQFCDTDFVGADAGKFNSPQALVEQVAISWPSTEPPFVICTGGEPLLQLDTPLIKAFHQAGFEIAIETNGTLAAPPNIDWICVSPKADAPLVLTSGDELKLVFPQPNAIPEMFQQLDFKCFYLQPMDSLERQKNTQLAVNYCLAHPQWRLSVQMHKGLGIR